MPDHFFNLKVWFADNRISIEHHEGGQKHRAAVQAKLRELGKLSKQKEKQVRDNFIIRTIVYYGIERTTLCSLKKFPREKTTELK